MKGLLPALTGIVLCMLCALAWHGASADVTDMPDVIDMSQADPITWHSLPPALPGAYLRQEIAENPRDRGNG